MKSRKKKPVAKKRRKFSLVKKLKQKMSDVLAKLKKLTASVLRILKLFTLGVVISLGIIALVLAADKAHQKYLEISIGDQVLYVENGPNAEIQGSATGFHLQTQKGNIIFVTNAHVCELKNSNDIILVHDKKYSNRLVPRRVIEIYAENDLCVVEPLAGYKGLKMANSVEVGEPVWSVGYPVGEALHINSGRVKDFGTTELIDWETPIEQCTGKRQKVELVNVIFFVIPLCIISFDSINTDLITYGGASGSPMLNIWGNVNGVIFAANNRTNWGRAVPLNDLKQFLEAY